MRTPPRTGSPRLAAPILVALGLLPSACFIDLSNLSGGKGGGGTTSTTGTLTTTTSGPVTAAQILALLGTCARYPGSTDFAPWPGKPNSVPICTLSGAVWWTSGMTIACDGGHGAVCKSSAGYSPSTAGTDSKGQPLDASTLPFVVVPAKSNGFDYQAVGLTFGSVAAVIYQDTLAYAVVGDVGDVGVAGEGSYALAQALGIADDPATGGVMSGVSYVLFEGPTAVVAKSEDHAEADQLGAQLAAELLVTN